MDNSTKYVQNRNHNSKNKALLNFKTVNVCGLSERTKFSLNRYIEDDGIDILALQETNTSDSERLQLLNMFCISDSNKAANKGVALYVKNCHTITKLEEISKITQNLDASWGLVIINNKKFIIGSIYVKLNFSQAIKEIIKMLDKADSLQKQLKATGIILAGDFNARHIAWGDKANNSYGKELLQLLDETRFSICTSNSPTFLCSNGNSRIDMFIVSNDLSEKMVSCETDENIELFTGAPQRGHLPLGITFYSRKPNSVDVIKKLDVSEMPWSTWSSKIEEQILEEQKYIEEEGNPYALWNKMNNIIEEATFQNAKFKKSCSHSKPFWNNNLTEMEKVLRNARKSYIKRNTKDNLEKYHHARDDFDTARKEECKNFLIQKTKNLNSVQSARFWKEFNSIFKKHTSNKVDPLEDGKGGFLTESKDISDHMFEVFFEGKHLEKERFDEKFYEEVQTLYEEIVKTEYRDYEELPEVSHLNQPISINEIKKAIKCNGKSVDNHNFHPKMLQNLGPNAVQLLQKIFNTCLEKKIWIWTDAQVIFLRKSGKDSYSKPGSYRPISITSYIGKLFERIISRRIDALLMKFQTFDPDQEGFTEGKNTIRYLNRLHLGIESDKESNLTILVLFVDFEKAYDSIWKKGLITKLYQLKIRGNMLHLIDDFITKRKVSLNINEFKSEKRQTGNYGLPQGAVLSVKLFKIFLMDFATELDNIPEITKYKFADDGSFKVTGRTTPECLATFQIVLDCLDRWAKKWHMKINCNKDKTEVICFNTHEKDDKLVPQTFKLGDNEIQRVKKTKVLGLTMDEQLNYDQHTEEVLRSVRITWVTLCKLSNRQWGLKQQVMIYLIKTLIISKWSYAGHIYMNKGNLEKINKLWYKILKSITGAVYNIKQEVAELILGLPPIQVQIQMNEIKHFLKVNFNRAKDDRYKEFLLTEYKEKEKTPNVIHCKLKKVFEFLQWKVNHYGNHFTEAEHNIIRNQEYGKLWELSPKASSYTKNMADQYVEKILWKNSLKTQFQIEGYSAIPEPSMKILPIPNNTKRNEEILLMSFMYKNNLLNHFLWLQDKVESPLCHKCKISEETPEHILFECLAIEPELQQRIKKNYILENHIQAPHEIDAYIGIINASRNDCFIADCLELVRTSKYRETIIL